MPKNSTKKQGQIPGTKLLMQYAMWTGGNAGAVAGEAFGGVWRRILEASRGFGGGGCSFPYIKPPTPFNRIST